jgi:hypothetical protein
MPCGVLPIRHLYWLDGGERRAPEPSSKILTTTAGAACQLLSAKADSLLEAESQSATNDARVD